MSILVDANTKVIVPGHTGKTGTFHTEQALAYFGTKMVAGITPGRAASLDRQVMGRIGAAGLRHRRRGEGATGADASVIYVPPAFAADAIAEAIDAEIPLIVCITEGIPVLDMVRVKRALERSKIAADRAELPGRAHARGVQDRHHARQHLPQGLGRRCFALRHAYL